MLRSLSLEQLRRLRTQAQGLHPQTTGSAVSVAQVVRAVGGLQSQELRSAELAVRVRSHGLTVQDVKRAREEDRSIVLTWCMRGTMHLVAADDLKWLLPFLGQRFIAATQRRYRQLGLDSQTRDRASQVMHAVLRGGAALTRPELADRLAAAGIPVEGQAIAHLVRSAALEGVICFGPERDGVLTYVLLDEWLEWNVPSPIMPEQTQTELVRRYLAAYGPATPDDFASWSGIPISQARAGFETILSDLLEVEMPGGSGWMRNNDRDWLDASQDGPPMVRLLPRYDTYLLGYKSRDFMMSPAYARRIHPGGGQINPALIEDGRVVGTWRSARKKKRLHPCD
ncbi:MAG: winged helix DNA-binding domain-containing protein [Anaerolineae bacterium]|nr:winged helix DNA-binding domain-containing protein [Anaerolineae bacterium]